MLYLKYLCKYSYNYLFSASPYGKTKRRRWTIEEQETVETSNEIIWKIHQITTFAFNAKSIRSY